MESSFRLARSESIKRGGRVGIRKIENEINGCQNATTSREWGCGWLVYADQNSNGSWDAQHDTLLQEFRPDAKVNVRRSANGSSLNFNRYGMTHLNAIGFTFSLLPSDSTTQNAQTLCISSGGRMRTIQATSCQ
ncbi:GspH/FimT family protein [Comamonas sp. NoAH]|uniref:GspH/FimT family protein n=1 Tax=Comamonas halotolerans TaxID=3041496 RepID=UPI0024E0DC01|nr:GspH/FimT family protein [Comamonas sp. NoAH]